MAHHRVLNIKANLNMASPSNTDIFYIDGAFEISLTGTWTGTVSILRRFDPADDWGIAQSYTENIEDSAFFKGPTPAYYMAAVTSAGTGTASIRIVK